MINIRRLQQCKHFTKHLVNTRISHIAIVNSKGSNFAAFFGGQTVNKPKVYNKDNANATSFASITGATSTENDSSASGNLFIFNPSGTTFAKHWISDINRMDFAGGNGYANRFQCGGYFNTTSAIDAIQFKFASGNIDAGTIKMYGLKDS